jgi:hypothetical protein
MNKVIGPTDNSLYFDMNTSADNITSGRDSQSMAINATNRTNLSRSTIFDMGFSRGESTNESADVPDTTVNAVTMGLQSMPSIDFNQNHRFTYYSINIDDSDSTNSTYAGNMAYHFTDRLDSNMSLSAGESTSEGPDKTESTKSLGAGFGLNYRLSKKLSLTETVSYSSSDTTANTPTNLDRELFRALTHLNYNDQFSWANLAASLRLGYNKDKTSDELSGSGIEQGVSVALSNIDINRYFLFNTSADYNRVYNLTGDVWSRNNSFQFSAYNKLWKRYVLLAAKYGRSSQSSWISAAETSSQNWSLNAISNYFRNTKIEATSEHTSNFDVVTGDIETDAETVNVTHNRYLAGGQLDVGFTYSFITNSFPGGSNEFNTYGLFGRYNKKLLRNLEWNAGASFSRGVGNDDSFKNITALNNIFTYQLRSWLLSAEQKYIHTEDQNRDLIENTLLFKAMRNFLWFL